LHESDDLLDPRHRKVYQEHDEANVEEVEEGHEVDRGLLLLWDGVAALTGREEAQDLLGARTDESKDQWNNQEHQSVLEVGLTVVLSIVELDRPERCELQHLLLAEAMHGISQVVIFYLLLPMQGILFGDLCCATDVGMFIFGFLVQRPGIYYC